jgi:subtilisin family serine protease
MATRPTKRPNPTLEAEMDLVLGLNPDIAVVPADWRQLGSYDYLYRRSQFLVADRDVGRATKVLGDVEVDDSLFDGVSLLRSSSDEEDGGVLRSLQLADDALGPGVVTPNHVLSVCGSGGRLCPAKEPETHPSGDPWPGVGDHTLGRGVRIAVVDTGFLREGFKRPWLEGVIVDKPDIEKPNTIDPKFIDPYAGHGTFIAGVIRCLAPGAEVSVEQVVDRAGVVDEAALIKQLDEALAKSPDIISFSAGGYTRNNLPAKGFVEFYENRLRHHKGVQLVAAAGNDSDRQPFWPAAMPWAVSVGALDVTGRQRARFSNFGGWVDVYAPGEDLVNAYAKGDYRSVVKKADIRHFTNGVARWSGTSFSTPVVAALIATRMSSTGENAQLAAQRLLEAARTQSLPGVGPRLWF